MNESNFEELVILAESGNAEAQFLLGMRYVEERIDYIVNPEAAFRWLEAAAKQDYLSAQKKLGELYQGYHILSPEYGWKVRRADKDLSAQWYQAAANHGDAESLYHLGISHAVLTRLDNPESLSDISFQDSFTQAEAYFQKCVQLGVSKWSGLAAEQLADLYHETGNKYAEDHLDIPRAMRTYKRAIKMYKYALASDNINKASCYFQLGILYNQFGDSAEAIEAYRCAIANEINNLIECYYNIGEIFEMDEDYTNAIASYKRAIKSAGNSYLKKYAEERIKELEEDSK